MSEKKAHIQICKRKIVQIIELYVQLGYDIQPFMQWYKITSYSEMSLEALNNTINKLQLESE